MNRNEANVFKTSELKRVKKTQKSWKSILALLLEQEIRLDPSSEITYGYYEGEKLVGTASVVENTIRSVAIAKCRQGSNTLAEMLDEVMTIMTDDGFNNIFIYTKPDSKQSFQNIGFYEVQQITLDETCIVLLERKPDGIRNFIKTIETFKTKHEEVGAIVMNANPFTLGHQYLIDYAATHCDFLYIFVVSTEKSAFPYHVRFNLIVEGTTHLNNVYVLNGGNYIISQATFPNYFLKKPSEATKFQAKLDVTIFGEHFVKALNIKKRFIGTEPDCGTTQIYNNALKEILPRYGVEVCEIPRKTLDDEVISASKVRQLIKVGGFEDTQVMVPITTYAFLTSADAKPIIEHIQKSEARH
jgi:[citrate (pro-3S)-lyase] ligase